MNQDELQKKWRLNILHGCNIATKDDSYTLLWDVYSTRRTPKVKKYAEENGILLQYIPVGLTEEWQTLDFRIFVSLKSRVRAAFESAIIENENEKSINWNVYITSLVKCCEDILRNETLNSCSKFETDATTSMLDD